MSVTKMPWETLGEQFVTQYYQIFDTNREQLVALYHVCLRPFVYKMYEICMQLC